MSAFMVWLRSRLKRLAFGSTGLNATIPFGPFSSTLMAGLFSCRASSATKSKEQLVFRDRHRRVVRVVGYLVGAFASSSRSTSGARPSARLPTRRTPQTNVMRR